MYLHTLQFSSAVVLHRIPDVQLCMRHRNQFIDYSQWAIHPPVFLVDGCLGAPIHIQNHGFDIHANIQRPAIPSDTR